MNEVLEQYKNRLIQQRYSQNTIDIYCNYFKDFCDFFKNYTLQNIEPEKINKYILHLIKTKNISPSQQNQRINAIKFYYEKILGREKRYYSLYRPKKEYKLPKVFSKNEVKRIFNSCDNIKHRCILMLTYSAGLRRSELIDLEISDIDSERMVVNIKGAKGKKDRISLLSENTLYILRDYYKSYKPKVYLFEGPKGCKIFSNKRSKYFEKICSKSRSNKKCYATYVAS